MSVCHGCCRDHAGSGAADRDPARQGGLFETQKGRSPDKPGFAGPSRGKYTMASMGNGNSIPQNA